MAGASFNLELEKRLMLEPIIPRPAGSVPCRGPVLAVLVIAGVASPSAAVSRW